MVKVSGVTQIVPGFALCWLCLLVMIGGCGGNNTPTEDTAYNPATASRYYPLRVGDTYLYRYSWGYWRRFRVSRETEFNGQKVFRIDELTFHEPDISKALTTGIDESQPFTYVSSDERGVLIHGGDMTSGAFGRMTRRFSSLSVDRLACP